MKKVSYLILLLAILNTASAQQPWYRYTEQDPYGANQDIRCRIKEIRQNGFDYSIDILAEGPSLLRLIHVDEIGTFMWSDTIVNYSSVQDDSYGDIIHEMVPNNVIASGNQLQLSGGSLSVIRMFEYSTGSPQWTWQKLFPSSGNQINSICQSYMMGDTLYAFQNDSILFIDPFNNGVQIGSAPFGQSGYDVTALSNGDFLMKTDTSLMRTNFNGTILWSISGVVASDMNLYFPNMAYIADSSGNVSEIDVATGNIVWTTATGLLHISALGYLHNFGVAGVTDNDNYQQQHYLFRINSAGNLVWTRSYQAGLFGFDKVHHTFSNAFITGGTYFTSTACFYQPQIQDVNNQYGAFVVFADSLGYGPEKISNVWEGDVNDDGVFDAADGLFLGIAMGSSGEDRASKGIPQGVNPFGDMVPAIDWGQSFPGGVNFKHADGNGDGQITTADASFITSLGSTHPNWRGSVPYPATGGFCLDYSVSTDTVAPGQTFAVYVIAGIPVVPVDTAYAFYIQPDFPNINLLNVSQSSFAALSSDFGIPGNSCVAFKAGSPVIGAGNNYYVSRTNQQNAIQLNDTIAAFYLTASASVSTPSVFDMGFMNGMKINLSGALDILTSCTPSLSVVIDPLYTGIQETVPKQRIAYPNPSNGIFYLDPGQKDEKFRICDAAGREVQTIVMPSGSSQLNLTALENGVYLMTDDQGNVQRLLISK